MPRGRKNNQKKSVNGFADLRKELFQAAINLRGAIEPADYKRYVLPIIFLRFLSLKYEKRYDELQQLVEDPSSEFHGNEWMLNDPSEYRSVGAFIVPENARWSYLNEHAQDDDIKIKVDNALKKVEETYPVALKGLLPRIFATSNFNA